MPKATTTYSPETIGSIMSSKVPNCRLGDSRATILEVLSKGEWDSVHQIYVLDQENKLRGIIEIALFLRADADIQKHYCNPGCRWPGKFPGSGHGAQHRRYHAQRACGGAKRICLQRV